MFADVLKATRCRPEEEILDVGVTSGDREDCNFFEKWYQHPHKLTAVGLENCSFLEKSCPGIRFVQADGCQLPFNDGAFDLAVSFAVIEHVGSRSRQKQFIEELCRVSNRVCVTTPNRWHPMEFHTVLPLIHWLPAPWARSIWSLVGQDFFSKEENLNLLDKKALLNLVPDGRPIRMIRYRLFGWTSNFMLFIDAPVE